MTAWPWRQNKTASLGGIGRPGVRWRRSLQRHRRIAHGGSGAWPGPAPACRRWLTSSFTKGLSVSARTANRCKPGTISRRSSRRLPATSGVWLDSPVTLPPGRARLATMPVPTGSPAVALHRLVDPDHGERLQQARVLQRTGINRIETELTDELHHHRLPVSIVASDQHDRLDRIVGRLGHIAGTRRVERLEDKGARYPACDLLAGRCVEPEDKLQPVGTHAQWVHAVDHGFTREAAEAFDRRLGGGPWCRDHHDLGLFDGFSWRFDAVLWSRGIFRIGGFT